MTVLPPSSDLVEQALREVWHQRKEAWTREGCPSSGPSSHTFMHANTALSDFLWKRAQRDIEEDRRKHPRAKRNQPVGSETRPGNRHLP